MEGERRKARIIDFHSHVLPGLDDGSRDKEMSRRILTETYGQKVRKMVATPHFYPDSMSLDSFLSQRQRAVNNLLQVWDKDSCPRVFLGAEVAFFSGIGESDRLPRLAIEGTNTLLLEMPYSRWSERTLEEVVGIPGNHGLKVVLAHVERYLHLQEKDTLDHLLSCGIFVQCNASFFLDTERSHTAMDMLEKGKIHVIGSDVHNLSSRRQRIGEARDIIREKCGDDTMERILENSRILLSGAVSIDQM